MGGGAFVFILSAMNQMLQTANFTRPVRAEIESTKITKKHLECGIQHSDLVIA
jgi:hypothetical protein